MVQVRERKIIKEGERQKIDRDRQRLGAVRKERKSGGRERKRERERERERKRERGRERERGGREVQIEKERDERNRRRQIGVSSKSLLTMLIEIRSAINAESTLSILSSQLNQGQK